MITRYITEEDREILESSLLLDEHHNTTPSSFFYEEGTVCSVYEDEDGPVCFVRGKPYGDGPLILQLDIQYLNNNDARRNMKIMLEGFPLLEQRAKLNGFIGFFFLSNVPLLRKFCIKRLGFQEYGEEALVKVFVDKPTELIYNESTS